MLGLFSSSIGFVDDKILLFPNHLNIPVTFDPMREESQIPDIKNIEGILPFSIVERIGCVGKYMCAVCMPGDSVLLYNMEKNEIMKTDINIGNRPWGNFCYVLFDDSCTFFFMCNDGIIYCFDIELMKVTKKRFCDDGIVFNPGSGVKYKNEVIIFSDERKYVRYRVDKNDWNVFYLDEKVTSISYVEVINDEVVLLCKDGWCYWLDLESNTIVKSINVDIDDVGILCKTDSKLIFLPNVGKDIIILDEATSKYYIYNEYPSDFEYVSGFLGSKYWSYCDRGNKRYFSNIASDYILSIDRKNSLMQWYRVMPPSWEHKSDILKYYMRHTNCVMNENFLELNDFLKYV